MTDKTALKGIGLDALFVDRKAIEEGDWVDKIPGADGVRVLTRGWNCADAIALRDKLTAARDRSLIDGTDEFEAAAKADPVAHNRAVMEAQKADRSKILMLVIKGWEGLGGIPFTPRNLEVICTNDDAMPARQILLNAAILCGQLKGSREEAQLKNFVAGLGISFEPPA